MEALRRAACIVLASAWLLAPSARATSYSTDVSDLWWIPTESGWGMQLVQQGSTVFATLFVYGQSGQPTWAVATLQSHGQGSYIWSGLLYVTSGPWFGGVFNPNMVGVTQAGTMTFQLSTVTDGNLTYSINGVEVTKQVTRETLVVDDYTGAYSVGVHMSAAACTSPSSNGDIAATMNLNVSQTAGNASLTWTFLNGNVCTYNGPYTQTGKVGAVNANYTCTSGERTTRLFRNDQPDGNDFGSIQRPEQQLRLSIRRLFFRHRSHAAAAT